MRQSPSHYHAWHAYESPQLSVEHSLAIDSAQRGVDAGRAYLVKDARPKSELRPNAYKHTHTHAQRGDREVRAPVLLDARSEGVVCTGTTTSLAQTATHRKLLAHLEQQCIYYRQTGSHLMLEHWAITRKRLILWRAAIHSLRRHKHLYKGVKKGDVLGLWLKA